MGGEKLAFAIDPQIDINSRALLDMISEEAMVQIDQPLLSAHEEAVAGNRKVTLDVKRERYSVLQTLDRGTHRR